MPTTFIHQDKYHAVAYYTSANGERTAATCIIMNGSQKCDAFLKSKLCLYLYRQQYDYDSSTIRKRIFQEALVQITLPTLQKALASVCKPVRRWVTPEPAFVAFEVQVNFFWP